jgi:membrane associated rhomboid family serine protease
LVALIILAREIFAIWWLTFLFFAPIFAWCILRIIAIQKDQGMLATLADNLTLLPSPYIEDDKRFRSVPWVTYALVALNVAVYYLVQHRLSEAAWTNLVFVSPQPNFGNVLLGNLTCMFLHGDGWHLWGNMAFLWAFGSVLERRLGRTWFLAGYLASGMVANLATAFVEALVWGEFIPGIGASGAISGLMGLFAIRCYFKTLVFPVPVLGLFAFLLPVGLKVRLNALVVIGLFFWADLKGGTGQVLGTNDDPVGYWCHLGGFLAGLLLGVGMRLGRQGTAEKDFDTAELAFANKRFGLTAEEGEAALRRYLESYPGDTQAHLLLARQLSRYELTDAGRDHYQRAVALLLQTEPAEALAVFREYFNHYFRPLEPSLQYRLAVLADRHGDTHFATRCLEALLPLAVLDPSLRAKCIYHLARLCGRLELEEAATRYRDMAASQTQAAKVVNEEHP